jgi:hypothetical protein
MPASAPSPVLFAYAFAALIAAAPPPAAACPVCDNPGAREVRAALVDDDFAVNLMAATLPSLVFMGFVAVVHFTSRDRGSRTSSEGRDTDYDRQKDQP